MLYLRYISVFLSISQLVALPACREPARAEVQLQEDEEQLGNAKMRGYLTCGSW